MNGDLKDTVRDVGEENIRRAHVYDSLKSDSEEQLNPWWLLHDGLQFWNCPVWKQEMDGPIKVSQNC